MKYEYVSKQTSKQNINFPQINFWKPFFIKAGSRVSVFYIYSEYIEKSSLRLQNLIILKEWQIYL